LGDVIIPKVKKVEEGLVEPGEIPPARGGGDSLPFRETTLAG